MAASLKAADTATSAHLQRIKCFHDGSHLHSLLLGVTAAGLAAAESTAASAAATVKAAGVGAPAIAPEAHSMLSG